MLEKIALYILACAVGLVGVFTLAIATNVVQALIAFLLFTISTLLIDAGGLASASGRNSSNLKRRPN
jgi:hypothetical protein